MYKQTLFSTTFTTSNHFFDPIILYARHLSTPLPPNYFRNKPLNSPSCGCITSTFICLTQSRNNQNTSEQYYNLDLIHPPYFGLGIVSISPEICELIAHIGFSYKISHPIPSLYKIAFLEIFFQAMPQWQCLVEIKTTFLYN